MNENVQDLQNAGQTETPIAPPAQEKMLPQSQVNELIGSAKQKGYEKGKNEAMASLPPLQLQSIADPEIVRQTVIAELQKQEQQRQLALIQQHNAQVASQLGAKFQDAKSRYPDFDSVVDIENNFSKTQDPAMGGVLHLVNSVDNSGDVLYDLMKNPTKLASILTFARGGNQNLAGQQIRALSDSIKQNQLAAQQPKTPEPLGQIKPSNIGLDNGSRKNSVSSLRNDPSYRG